MKMIGLQDDDYCIEEEDQMNKLDVRDYNECVVKLQLPNNPKGLYFRSHCELPQCMLLPLLPENLNKSQMDAIPLSAVDTTVLIPITFDIQISDEDCHFSFKHHGSSRIYVCFSLGICFI